MSDDIEYDFGVAYGDHRECIYEDLESPGRRKPCSSSDGMMVYEHQEEESGVLSYDAHCFVCKSSFSQSELKSSRHGPELYDGAEAREGKPRKPKREPITLDEMSRLKATTGFTAFKWRGLFDEYNEFYGHRTRVVDGKPIARYYPETQDSRIKGFKCRVFPKDFSRGKLGLTGNMSELSGQAKFRGKKGKYILIVGGEEDKVAAYQMLRESQKARGQGEFAAIPVVSPTSGEGSCAKQCAANREFLDQYDFIIVGLDNDKAGIEAMAKTAAVLPKHKVKLVKWSDKDPNHMLQQGKEKQFVRDFYQAEEYVASGIKTSSQLSQEMVKELLLEKASLPPFMSDLQHLMKGGIPLGVIVNIIAETSVGKTAHVNSIFLHMLFHSPYKLGVVSLELTAGQYAISMLSKFAGVNLLGFENGQDAVDLLATPEMQAKEAELWTNEVGEPRWALLDERDGSIEGVQTQVEKLIHIHECKFVVIDVLSDLLEGASIEEQGLHMRWQKGSAKNGVTIINVVHTRKAGLSKDGSKRKVGESDAYGSSTITKSAACNIILHRDKMEEDLILRNTTEVEVPKCRWSGLTGAAGQWFYDNKTSQTYDYNTYFGAQGHDPEVSGVKEAEAFATMVEPLIIDRETGEVLS